MSQKVITRFWEVPGLSSASRNHLITFCRPSVHNTCLRLYQGRLESKAVQRVSKNVPTSQQSACPARVCQAFRRALGMIFAIVLFEPDHVHGHRKDLLKFIDIDVTLL